MRKIILIAKAITDKNRIRALMARRRQSFCVCQIVDLIGLAPSTISKHLSVLYHAGLVSTEKKGRWVYYSRINENEDPLTRQTLQLLDAELAQNEEILADETAISKVLKKLPGEFCQ